jgi:transcriptional regulator with GAF, ATPase, and Fis domain
MWEQTCAASTPDAAAARILGASEAIQQLRCDVAAIAPLASTVLVTGETGTGKGRVARALHALSPRAGLPFVHVDCAALSPTVIESELFGHERGSFTSAEARRAGRFELAGDGTVFLDEIGDLEPHLQSKLLRVLDDREFERVGGTTTLHMRARVLAATSRDLRQGVAEGRFRADLFFRLNVFHLHIPPLRERPQDLAPLVEDGLDRASRRLGLTRARVGPGLLERLAAHGWPGNVRELLNVLERLAVRRPGALLGAGDVEPLLEHWLPRAAAPASASAPQAERSLAEFFEEMSECERAEILGALSWSGGNVAAAARRLRIPRGTLRHKMKKYSLEPVELDAAPVDACGGAPGRELEA